MSRSPADFPTSNDISEMGIQLALDPNLISLPLHGSTATPLGVITNENTTSQEGQLEEHQSNIATAQDQTTSEKKAKGQSLIANPYELYGQMQLSELIPLILLQRGPGFKFSDLSEDALQHEVENEDNVQGLDVDEPIDSEMASSGVVPADDESDIAMDIEYRKKTLDNHDIEVSTSASPELSKTDFVAYGDHGKDSTTQEQFLKIRKEMIDHINLAMNESSLALEFLSLLLSSVKESTALTSMSPFLKKAVPVRSLNSDKLPPAPISKEEQVKSEILNRGWKLRSLNESRYILKDNFEKIELVISREHVYWNKISRYVSNKDVIFKMRDRSTGLRSLGIKYGYEDSGSTYKRDRGVAVLRNNSEQNLLELIPSSIIENPTARSNEKFIRLRIFTKIESEDDYILTGESSLDSFFLNGAANNKFQDDIRGQIQKLKAFVFEQELMYQSRKECSLLISYGVTIENENKIVMELPNEKIEIELLPIDDSSVVNHIQDPPKVNDRRATLMLTSLRMLLVVMFKKNLKKRLTFTRSSLSVDKDVLLIRPLLGRMRHQNYKILLRKIIKDYILEPVEGSTLTETPIYRSEYVETAIDINVAKLSKEITAFDRLLDPSKTKFQINMLGTAEFVLVLSSPNYCNAIVAVNYKDPQNQICFNTEFSEFKEIEEFSNFLVTEYIKNKDNIIKSEE